MALSTVSDLELRAAQYEANGAWEDYVSMAKPTVPRRFLRDYADAAYEAFSAIMDAHSYDLDGLVWEWHGNDVWSSTYNDTRAYASWNGAGTWSFVIMDISGRDIRMSDVYEIGQRSGAGLTLDLVRTPLTVISYRTAEIDLENAEEGDAWVDAWGTGDELPY